MKFVKKLKPDVCQDMTTKVNDVMAKATNKYKSQKQQMSLQIRQSSDKMGAKSGGLSNGDRRTYVDSEDYRYSGSSNNSSPHKHSKQQQSGRAWANEEEDYGQNELSNYPTEPKKYHNRNKKNRGKVPVINNKNIRFAQKE